MIEIADSVIPDLAVISESAQSVKPGSTNETKLRVASADNVLLAAQYTPSQNEHVKEIRLLLKKNGTIASGKTLALSVQSDSSGLPSGIILGVSEDVQTDTVPSAAAWVTFTFPHHIQLTKNTVYHIVLNGNYNVSATNNVSWISATVASGGNQEIKDASWSDVATEKFNVSVGLWNLHTLGLAEPTLYALNVLTNPTFDNNTTGWSTGNGGTLTHETAVVHKGKGAAKVTSDGTNFTYLRSPVYNTTESKFWMTRLWARVPAANVSKTLRMQLTDQNDVLFALTDITLTADVWVPISIEVLAPGTQTGLKIIPLMVNPAAGDIFYADTAALLSFSEYPGIFTSDPDPIELGDIAVQSQGPVLDIRSEDIAAPVNNAEVNVRGVSYAVMAVHTDAEGFHRLELTEN